MFNHVVIWGSVAFYFAITLFINSNLIKNQYIGCLRMTLSTGHFWFTLFLTLAILLIPVIAIRFYNVNVNPTLSDRCRLKQRLSRLRTRPIEHNPMRRRSSVRRSRRSIRSGYAFAHQEGFGRLITSGKLVQKNSIRSNSSTIPNSLSTSMDPVTLTGAGGHGHGARTSFSTQPPMTHRPSGATGSRKPSSTHRPSKTPAQPTVGILRPAPAGRRVKPTSSDPSTVEI